MLTPGLGEGRRIEVRANRYQGPGGNRLVWRWYDVGGQLLATDWEGKVSSVLAQLRGEYRGARLGAVAADYGLRPQEAKAKLQAFLRDSGLYAPGAALAQ